MSAAETSAAASSAVRLPCFKSRVAGRARVSALYDRAIFGAARAATIGRRPRRHPAQQHRPADRHRRRRRASPNRKKREQEADDRAAVTDSPSLSEAARNHVVRRRISSDRCKQSPVTWHTALSSSEEHNVAVGDWGSAAKWGNQAKWKSAFVLPSHSPVRAEHL